MKPTLAIIDIDIISGQDELAREALLENLNGDWGPFVTVLWVNWLRERADLRVVCLVKDLEHFDDFLVNTIRAVPGVGGTSALLAFDGMVRGEAVMDVSLLESLLDRRAAATVLVKSEPGKDREVYRALVELPPHQQVELVWVVKVFHSSEADLLVLLLGERSATLTGYVMSWIRTVPGVLDTQISTVQDWRIFGDTGDFIALTQRFPESAAKAKVP